MNATNRILNRTLLLVVGLILAAVGAAMIFAAARPSWASDAVNAATGWTERTVADMADWTVELSGAGAVPGALLVLLGIALVLIVLLIVFIATRGGGGTSTVVRVDAEDGSTEVDRDVADAVLAARLRARPDVLSARLSAYRVTGRPALKLTVTVRQGTVLSRTLRAAEDAVAEWDALAGTETPVVLHLVGRGWWDRWRSATRVQ